jgi:hypothetical protein
LAKGEDDEGDQENSRAQLEPMNFKPMNNAHLVISRLAAVPPLLRNSRPSPTARLCGLAGRIPSALPVIAKQLLEHHSVIRRLVVRGEDQRDATILRKRTQPI